MLHVTELKELRVVKWLISTPTSHEFPFDIHIRPYALADASEVWEVWEAAHESLAELQPWMPWCHPAYSIEESRSWLEAQVPAFLILKWTDVESLRVTRTDDSVKPPRIELEIVLRNGKKVPAALFRQGQMKLLGKTDLGDYSIDLEKVRTIAPVR